MASRRPKKPGRRKSSPQGKRGRRTRAAKSVGTQFENLVALQARLLAPGGCPWDREQTHKTLRGYLIEEAYETLDALESGDPEKFADELGDLLLQIVFHARLASQSGRFDISDVIRAVHTKMVRRHPHVFGTAQLKSAAQVLKRWEEIKAEERAAEAASGAAAADNGLLTNVPKSLPGLLEASKMTRRAARIGFDWDDLGGVLDKLSEEADELRAALRAKKAGAPPSPQGSAAVEEEVGDLLFAAANVGRFLGVDPEIALKGANRKFRRRFEWMEKRAGAEGAALAEMPRERMEELWNEAKISK